MTKSMVATIMCLLFVLVLSWFENRIEAERAYNEEMWSAILNDEAYIVDGEFRRREVKRDGFKIIGSHN